MSVCVCVCVCLCVCLSVLRDHIFASTRPIFTEFFSPNFCARYEMAVARSCSGASLVPRVDVTNCVQSNPAQLSSVQFACCEHDRI